MTQQGRGPFGPWTCSARFGMTEALEKERGMARRATGTPALRQRATGRRAISATTLATPPDDLPELPLPGASALFVAALARQAPPSLHLVLCGRGEPPFRLERLCGRGEVLSLGAADLGFTLAEVEDLLARVDLAQPGLAQRV